MKYEDIQRLTESLRNCLASLEEIEPPEPDIEEGQYWKIDKSSFPFKQGEILRINSTTETHASFEAIGRNHHSGNGSKVYLEEVGHLLSDDGVEDVLMKEARQRGYETGLKVISAQFDMGGTIGYPEGGGTGYELNGNVDTLYIEGIAVYHKGNWAEIIEDEWQAKRKGMSDQYFVENSNGDMISGVSFYLDKEQAEEIRDALNNMED